MATVTVKYILKDKFDSHSLKSSQFTEFFKTFHGFDIGDLLRKGVPHGFSGSV